jgi:hypothetical protein
MEVHVKGRTPEIFHSHAQKGKSIKCIRFEESYDLREQMMCGNGRYKLVTTLNAYHARRDPGTIVGGRV